MAMVAGLSGLALLAVVALNAMLIWRSRGTFRAALMGPRAVEVVCSAPTGESNVIALASRRPFVARLSGTQAAPRLLAA
jgi:hypothetical protein